MDRELAMWIVGGLVVALAALVQWWMRRIEGDIKAMRAEARTEIATTRKEAKEQIDGIGQRLHAHQLDVATNYVSVHRLAEALVPFRAGIDELKAEVRADLARIFERLDSKADKPHG